MGIGARHHHLAGFNRLAQRFQHIARKLGEFIHEQHTIVRQADFARLRPLAAANNGCHRRRVMRLAERAAARNAAFRQKAGQRMHHRGFQCLGCRKVGKNTGQARGQHGFSRPRAADHQHMVPPGGSDFQRPLCPFLTLDIAHVAALGCCQNLARLGGGNRGLAGVMAHHIMQRTCCNNLCRADPGRLGSTGARTQQDAVVFGGGHRCRQGTDHRHEGAIQRKLTQGEGAVDGILRKDVQCRQQGNGDGQVEMRAFLGQVRR